MNHGTVVMQESSAPIGLHSLSTYDHIELSIAQAKQLKMHPSIQYALASKLRSLYQKRISSSNP